MSKTILEVEDLKTYFFLRRGVAKVVDGVSFSLHEGETLGLVGESGSGKSMTCLSVLRLVPRPTGRIVGGRILFNGQDLLKKSEKEMREIRGKCISMILQDPMVSLDPVFTIGSQVAEAVVTHDRLDKRKTAAKVEDMLRSVKIPSPEARMAEFPHQMSGGMRQRIVAAIALSCEPRVLIADEPTTSLDTTIQSQFLQLLNEVQRKSNIGIILVTHDLGIVARLCHRVSVMYAGKIVESADVRELFNNAKHPYTVALMNCLPKMKQRSERLFCIEGQPPHPLHRGAGCSFAPRCCDIKKDLCHAEYPPEVTVSPGHTVSCWLAS